MPIQVSIAKGKGRVTCVLPGFHLDEKTRPSVIVEETTEQLDNLAKRGLIVISEITGGAIDKKLKKLSKRFTARAINVKLAQLKKERETGGVSQVTIKDGNIERKETVVPAELTPDEIKALAAAEIKSIETGDSSALDALVGAYTGDSNE